MYIDILNQYESVNAHLLLNFELLVRLFEKPVRYYSNVPIDNSQSNCRVSQ